MKNINIDEVLTRGVAQILPDKETLKKLMAKRKIKLYLGIDPTGSLLTLGHSVVLRKLKQFADLGHEVILLIGNGTVKIGDPTGRDSTRPMLTDAQIEENFKTWKSQASKILDFKKITIKRNGDWLDKLAMPEIIQLAAKTTLQQLIERDMFQERIKKNLPIFTHEILYPLLQGYDSVAMNVDLELGGTDQTFNMLAGRQLVSQILHKEKFVMTVPLLTDSKGTKIGKTEGNVIGLTDAPAEFYAKIMSLGDDAIIPCFTLLTDIPTEEIETKMKQGENPMTLKKQLAFELTKMLNDEKLAKKAQEEFESVHQKNIIIDFNGPELEIPELDNN